MKQRQFSKKIRKICRKIGENGEAFLEDGSCVITHCNAGGLATGDFGTALAVMFAATDKGKKISVYADETRPLLTGLQAYGLGAQKCRYRCNVDL